MKELICIVCPKGCHLRIDEENGYAVQGNACARGVAYGQKELQNPTRTFTSTVRVLGTAIPRLPVKTDRDIPKASVPAVARLLDGVTVTAPVQTGDVIVENIGDTGANLLATRSLGASDDEAGCGLREE